MADKPTYKRITLLSKADPATGQFNISDWEKDIRAIVNNAVKSSLTDDTFFKLVNKRGTASGQMGIDIYVHQNTAPLVEKAINQQVATLTHKGSLDPKYSVLSPVEANRRVTRELRRGESESSSTDTESIRSTKHNFLKIIGGLTVIADIARRILSSVIALAERTTKDMITASNLGMSFEAVRGYRHTEAVHGLKEGTVTGAVSDLQMKFGNITSLDEKALEALAVVMGGKIEEMVKMGLGSSNPEAVLGAILDDFNAKANAGYNSVGQYVGEQQARRELYSYLLKVSPQVADIFATMQEEQHNINSLYRNQADTFENWKNAFPVSRGDPKWGSYGVLSIADQQWKQIKDILNQIKEGVLMTLAPDIVAILKRIGNSRIFMSESERREANIKNREANEKELASINKTLALYKDDYDNMGVGGKAYYDVLVEQKQALEKELGKEEIDDITTLPAELEVRAERKVKKQIGTVDYDVAGVIPLSDVTYEEIKDVASVYNLDTAEKRQQYADYRKREAKKADRDVEAYNNKEQEKYRKQFYDEWQTAGKGFKKDSKMKKYSKALNPRAQDDLMLLYKLSKIYNFDIDLDKEEGENTEERLYSALNRLQKADPYMVSMDSMGKWRVSHIPYVNKHFTPLPSLDRMITVEYDDAYYKWLYEQEKDEMTPHIQALRAEEEINKMQEGNPIQAWDWLHSTEGTKEDWRNKLSGIPAGTYIVRGENIQGTNGYGENIYRMVVDIKENGKLIESREVYSSEGGHSASGEIGTATLVYKNGKLDFVTTQATPASKQKQGD